MVLFKEPPCSSDNEVQKDATGEPVFQASVSSGRSYRKVVNRTRVWQRVGDTIASRRFYLAFVYVLMLRLSCGDDLAFVNMSCK